MSLPGFWQKKRDCPVLRPVTDFDRLARPVSFYGKILVSLSHCPGTMKELLSLCSKKLHCPVLLETLVSTKLLNILYEISYKKKKLYQFSKQREISKLPTFFCCINDFYYNKSQIGLVTNLSSSTESKDSGTYFTIDSLSFLNSIEVHTFLLGLHPFWFRLCDILLEFCQTW